MDKNDDEACCKNCRFYRKIGVGDRDTVMICAEDSPRVTHVLAPEQGLQGMSLVWKSFSGWPVTQDDRWCGKHQRVKH